ncbi:MAG: ABC transporter ATP-binding protein [Paracoccaceae bacterium]
MSSIKCKKINKSFGDIQVLNDIDLDINMGEFIVFVGPSGCGKTTLLRLISGLEDISSGDLFIGDTRVNDVSPKHRDIAMVFQNYAIYPHMSVAENISFGMKVRGNSKAERKAAVDEVAAILGLEHLLDRKPKQLSGGQRQRVAMGRAIVRRPSVFLMDEPLSNLDAKLRNQMRVEIKNLQRRLQTTTIYVTHDQVEAMTLADKIAIMKDGEILQFGTPDELYSRPTNKFVASFLGTPQMNFLKAEPAAKGKLLLENGCTLKIPPAYKSAVENLDNIEIGIRPESLRIGKQAKSSTVNWQSTVDLCEALGSETIVHFETAEQAFQGKISRGADISEGDMINVGFDAADVYLFCGSTGECVGHALNG